MFNVLVITYMAFTGLGTGLCACTGKYIGAGMGARVPALIVAALLFAAAFALAICALLWLARDPIARLFTSDADVIGAPIPWRTPEYA